MLFSVAMAFLESAVVVYIRELLYPDGFKFPLAAMDSSLALTEIIREAATIIMLAGAAVIAGKTFSQKFAWFLFCFAVWDIFYYIFLKLIIGWPSSLFEWDVLFLIPVTWTGPVISPLIVAVLMIILAMVIIIFFRLWHRYKNQQGGVDYAGNRSLCTYSFICLGLFKLYIGYIIRSQNYGICPTVKLFLNLQ